MAFLKCFSAKLPQTMPHLSGEMWDRLTSIIPDLGYEFIAQDGNRYLYRRGSLEGNTYSFDPRKITSRLLVCVNPRGITYRFFADCFYQYITRWEETVWLFELDQIAQYVSSSDRLEEQALQLASERKKAMAKYFATLGMTSYHLPARWHHLYDRKIIRRSYYLSLPRLKRRKLYTAA